MLETDPWAELMEKYRVSAEVARDALAKLNALEAEFPLVPKPDPCK